MARGGVAHPELDAIFASAPHVITETIRQDRQSQVPMEPHGIIVRWKEFDRELHVWSSCQRVHEVRATLCRVLGIGEHAIHVTQRDVGGGFGQKGAMRTEEIAAALGAYLMGRTLKWVEDRAREPRVRWSRAARSHHGDDGVRRRRQHPRRSLRPPRRRGRVSGQRQHRRHDRHDVLGPVPHAAHRLVECDGVHQHVRTQRLSRTVESRDRRPRADDGSSRRAAWVSTRSSCAAAT